MSQAPALAYAEGLAAGELRFQRCSECERAVFHPRVLCPHCGAESLEWHTSSGTGTVYASTVLHKRGSDPYNVALIDLDEGFRMMSRVEGVAPEDVHIGSRVGLAVITEDGAPLAVFRPLEVRA
ncbi:Zn-ribbon domain-containing OB-fold protein [Streptomyces sp. NBC_01717]|uniref:Zn-ribbon domain-containing OB-fold protein n=1 Tax=Streptomyces sp. NBC_01717 TaxID=2975918 RepID=UPI002E341549|nr:Zn-ribbon domain-containing OB-fold protein [Streptomyces sp. NBC_01717]